MAQGFERSTPRDEPEQSITAAVEDTGLQQLGANLRELQRRQIARPLDFARRFEWQELAWTLLGGGDWKSEWGPAPQSLLAAVLIRCSREEGGIRALARRMNVSPQTLYNVIGGREPGRHVLRAICDYLAERPPDTELTVDTVRSWARLPAQLPGE